MVSLEFVLNKSAALRCPLINDTSEGRSLISTLAAVLLIGTIKREETDRHIRVAY